MSEVAEDLKAIFKVRRGKTARALAEEFIEVYGRCFPKAVSVFEAGMDDALTYLGYPGSHLVPHTHDGHAGARGWGGKQEDEGGGGVP